MRRMKNIILAAATLLASMLLFAMPQAYAADASSQGSSTQVLAQFDQQQMKRANGNKLSNHRKHVILFMLAVPLIILLLVTGGLGIAMGVYGKQQLFVTHMVFAGLTITLALVHAIVSMIWFFPF